jgi:alkaline phosphatase D
VTDPIRYDRRQFLQRAGLAGAATAVATVAPRPLARADDDLAPFLHGVASGDPTADAVVIWTRLTTGEPEAPVLWEVATDLDLHDVIASGQTVASADRDHTVKVDVTGLPAGTWLYYRFLQDGRSSLVGRTRTAPVGAVAGARFGVVSCSNYQHGFFNAYARLAEREDLDAILHLGDYLYEYQVVADGGYGEDEANLAGPRRHDPPVEMVDLDDYRTRHAQYKLDPDLRRLHQLFPWVTTWDDHESTNNSYRDGAENHDDTEGDWETRKNFSRQVYDEWMPTRTDDPARLWRAFRWGDLLDLVVLDTRLERDPIIGTMGATVLADEVDDPDRIMLSEEQRAFLYDALAGKQTAWKVIQQQVIMAPWNAAAFPTTGATQDVPIPVLRDDGNTANPDQWDGYTAERRNLFDHIRDNAIEDVVVLTGDVHSSWAIDLTDTPFDVSTYNPATGEGAIGVEFVCTSVTSSGPAIVGPELAAIEAGTRADNPHVKWTNFSERGYMVLDVTPERAQADWWLVDTVLEPSDGQQHGANWLSVRGDNHLTEADAAVEHEARVPTAPGGVPPVPAGPADGDQAGDAPSLPVTGGGVALGAAAIAAGGFLRLAARRNDMEQGR